MAETYRDLSSNRTQFNLSSFQIVPLMALPGASQGPGGLRRARQGPGGPHGYLGGTEGPMPTLGPATVLDELDTRSLHIMAQPMPQQMLEHMRAAYNP